MSGKPYLNLTAIQCERLLRWMWPMLSWLSFKRTTANGRAYLMTSLATGTAATAIGLSGTRR